MTSENSRYRPPTGSNAEEKRAWAGFYARVKKESTLAAEVIAQLDRDSELKRMHLALYLCCRESLRGMQAREARNERIAKAVRWMCYLLFVMPVKLLIGGLSRSTDIALASLPEQATQLPVVRPAPPVVRSRASADKGGPVRPTTSPTG